MMKLVHQPYELEKPPKGRAIVIGGSLGGLFAGILLRSIGWQVDIYERSPHSLSSRGGGIVLKSEILQAFRQAGITTETSWGVAASERLFLASDGSIAQRMNAYQTQTSWNVLYNAMRRHFPAQHYHSGKALVSVDQNSEMAIARFADASQATADLLIGADGALSQVRRQLLPSYEPSYAGYIAYRGLVEESRLSPLASNLLKQRFVFYQFPNSHILQYLIPGEDGSLEPGKRRFNWVWYVNYDEKTELPTLLTDRTGDRRLLSVPPGMMAPDVEAQMRTYAGQVLPPPFQELIASTAQPFVQSVLDLGVPQMAFGRIALVGDAAFMVRPHTASGVSKGAANALALAEALVAQEHNVSPALEAWETEQLRLGMYLWQKGMALGERQFMYGQERFQLAEMEEATALRDGAHRG